MPTVVLKRKGKKVSKSNDSQCSRIVFRGWSYQKKTWYRYCNQDVSYPIWYQGSNKQAFKLGKRGAKPKISLSSDVDILKNCTKLRNSNASPIYNNIFITPDLTLKEQEGNKQFRAELNKCNKEGRSFQIKK